MQIAAIAENPLSVMVDASRVAAAAVKSEPPVTALDVSEKANIPPPQSVVRPDSAIAIAERALKS